MICSLTVILQLQSNFWKPAMSVHFKLSATILVHRCENTMIKTTWVEKDLFKFTTLRSYFITKRNQKQDLMVGTWRQKLKQRPWRKAAYWLASYDLLSVPSYIFQDHLPKGGTTHNELGPPMSIISQDLPIGHFYGDIFLLRFSFPGTGEIAQQ